MKRMMRNALVLSACFLLAGCGNTAQTVSENEAPAPSIDEIDPDEYIELGKYKGLSVVKPSSEVTDEDVEAEFLDNLEYLLKPEDVTDREEVEEGDIVNIDFVGKLDGVAFEGGTGKGYDLTIGSHSFIEGFEEGLIGKKVGEQVDLDLTFPANYPNNRDLENKPVVFEVSVNSIKRMPEPTDENIKEATDGGFATIEEYKKSLRESLEQSSVDYADSEMYSDLWDQVVENSKLKKDLPEQLVKEKMDIISDNAKSYAQSYGLEWETYLSQMLGKTQEEFDSEAMEYASKAAKETLVMMALTKAEGIDLSAEELDKAAKEYVELYKYGSVEEFYSTIDIEQFREYVLMSKIHEFLADQAVIKTE